MHAFSTFITILSGALLANARALPDSHNSDSKHTDKPLFDPKLQFTPGSAEISPSYCTNITAYSPNLCPPRLPSRNMIVTAIHQIVEEGDPTTVKTSAFNGLSAGFDIEGNESRTYAIFPTFPANSEGKQCRFHFVTDGGPNLMTRKVINHWNIYALRSGHAVWNETTWDNQPTLDEEPVAKFVTDLTSVSNVHPDDGSKNTTGIKHSHSFISGDDFPCPAGKSVAWALGPAGPAPKNQDSYPAMFSGGQNGIMIEVLNSAAISGWPELEYFTGEVMEKKTEEGSGH